MRATRLVAFADTPSFELHELPDPEPGRGQAVVAVRAAALNRRDPWIWKTPGYCPLPVTLGSDGAGTVVAVGPPPNRFAVGDEVVINAALNWDEDEDVPGPEFDILGAPTDGTFAERVLVPDANLEPKPERLTWEEAAALNVSGLTAWRALVRCAWVATGKTLLVTGAGGGVSTFLIQIAHALGARVFVTSSSEEKIEKALALGAEAGFCYDDPGWPEALRAEVAAGLDAVVDSYGAASWAQTLPALRDGGVLVTLGDTGGTQATVEVMDVYWHWRSIVGTSMGSPDEFRALLAHVLETEWRPVIDSAFPLEDLPAAAERLEAPDRFGKVVLTVA